MLKHPQLTMGTPRLFEDLRLKDSSPERIKEITVVESAYDSVLCADFTYVSTPITSGAILYRVLKDTGVKDADELRKDKAFFYTQVIVPNIQAAEQVAQTMLTHGGAVIAPAMFEAKSLGWSQDDYMGLWLDTIENKATRLAMVPGWQYSNGGCEEYLQALLMQAGRRERNNIAIVDHAGQPIDNFTAIDLLYNAIVDLLDKNFVPTTLIRVLQRCLILHAMVDSESDYGIRLDRCGKQRFSLSEHYLRGATPFWQHVNYQNIRQLLHQHVHLLVGEISIRSSLDLHPGLIRQEERQELETTRAKAQRLNQSEED